MIRMIQKHLIIPRGDTGTFSIPSIATVSNGDASVFTIFDPLVHKKIFEKVMQVSDGVLTLEFTHADTVNLPVGQFVWDIKFYKNANIVDGVFINGDEIDSYYAAFKLPVCEIRQTGDTLLTADDAPTTTVVPEQLNIILAAASEANNAKIDAAQSAEQASAALGDLQEILPTLPTKLSDLDNDVGYITDYTETDPTVPAWAKTVNKPSYTAQEVGALPNNTFIPTRISDLVDDSGHYTKPVGGIPASDLASGVLDVWSGLTYHTSTMSTDADSFVLGGATDSPTEINKCLITSTPEANVIPKFDYQGRLHSITPEEEWDGSNAVATTEYVDNMISDNMPEVPTNVSELNNDAGYLTSFTETDPTVPSWAKAINKPTYTASEVGAPTIQEMNTAISTAIGNVHQFEIEVVQELPTTGIKEHTVYFVPKTGETNDVYDEYIYINNAWEMVGNTQIDLSNYATKSEIPNVPVQDVQVNGTSVLNNETANIPIADVGQYGVFRMINNSGLIMNNGALWLNIATSAQIKAGIATNIPPNVRSQDLYTFYGLAKAAGDSTQAASDNPVGTYTSDAKSAIKTMLGVSDPTVTDVQINETSIVNNGVAAIPVASYDDLGVVKVSSTFGIAMGSSGANAAYIRTYPATSANVKSGTDYYRPITPIIQHEATFYGLAKAAGDSTQSVSNNVVGTYTDEAKSAIQHMLGTDQAIASYEADSVADNAYAQSDIFMYNGKLYRAISAIAVGDYITPNGNCTETTINNVFVKFNDYATSSTSGVVKVNRNNGIGINGAGQLYIDPANVTEIKAGTSSVKSITPSNQDSSTFYGLAKSAGVDMASSSNAIGTYTDDAKSAIRTMIGAAASSDIPNVPVTDVQVTGSSVLNNGVANIPYASLTTPGVVKVAEAYGISITSTPLPGFLKVSTADTEELIKSGNNIRAFNVANQHIGVFYGLAKAAGADMKDIVSTTVGTYPNEQKAAIQSMLGVSSLLATSEPTLVASKAYAIGDVFTANGKLYKVTTAIAAAETIVVQNEGETVSGHSAEECKVTDYAVHDVQVNGTSIVSNGVANIPIAGVGVKGVVMTNNSFGIISDGGLLKISHAYTSVIKPGTNTYLPITPDCQHASVFYGLAKAAGDTTQSNSSNVVGTYTDTAKSTINTMLNGSISVSGTAPTITALAGVSYVCGEVSTLDITLPASGCIDVVFQSGSTATVLTVTPPTGVTVKWAGGFDPTALEANTTYEINIKDGLGVCVSWT